MASRGFFAKFAEPAPRPISPPQLTPTVGSPLDATTPTSAVRKTPVSSSFLDKTIIPSPSLDKTAIPISSFGETATPSSSLATQEHGAAKGRTDDSHAWHTILAILEARDNLYHVAWADTDPNTGIRYLPTWEPVGNANHDAVAHWRGDVEEADAEEDEGEVAEIIGIVDEHEETFTVRWAGTNPATKEAWEDGVVAKGHVNREALRVWEMKRMLKQRREKEKTNKSASKRRSGQRRKA